MLPYVLIRWLLKAPGFRLTFKIIEPLLPVPDRYYGNLYANIAIRPCRVLMFHKVIQPLEMESKMEWKGVASQRFGGHRAHLRPEDSLTTGLRIADASRFQQGIKCFPEQRSGQIPQRRFLRTYDQAYRQCQKEIDNRGRKNIDFVPTDKPPRPQRVHLQMGECKDQRVLRGIKTYQEANSTSANSYNLQEKLQRKARILGLQDQRNGLDVTSLGDKTYKYPQYASNFYKQGGLIVGSTNANRRSSNHRNAGAFDQLKIVPLTKPNWQEKARLEEEQEDRKYVQGIDIWQQTVLPEINPKWQDPNRPPGGSDASKQPPKDNKKAAKK